MGAHGRGSTPPTSPNPGLFPSVYPPAPPVKKSRVGAFFTGALLAAVACSVVGYAIGYGAGTADGSSTAAAIMTPAATRTVTATPKARKTASLKPVASPSPSPVVIDDGTWVVGEDVRPGTYKARTRVESDCYWAIYKSGTNGETIVQNDFPGGGRPVVTLRRGQDFRTTRCGEWVRQ